MGKFTYDSTMTVDVEDRALTHLQIVIGAKLGRGESFQFTWKDDPEVGSGRTTIWMHPSLPMGFKYYDSKVPALNRRWVEALMESANTTAGLHLVPEPPQA